MSRYALPVLALLLLAGCETTREVTEAADDTADAAYNAAEDVTMEAYELAVDGYDVVTDAAGDAYEAVEDLFDGDPSATAVALVRPTGARGSTVQGTVTFTEVNDGLRVAVSLQGLTPGQHGLHIHQNANCAPADSDGDGLREAAGAAGPHWDPHSTDDHGAPADDPLTGKHLGDLGNVTASASGSVSTTFTVDAFNPNQHDVAGHAVVVHSGRDDLMTDPSGDAGSRMGCGVIEARM